MPDTFVSAELAQITLDSIGDAVLSIDLAGRVTYLNPVAEHMTGWPIAEAVGKPIAEVLHIIDSETREPAPNPLEKAMRLNRATGMSANSVLITRDGSEAPIEDTAAPIHDRDGQITGAVIVFHDVSLSRLRMMEMSHMAQHDALTELPNRVLVRDRLTQALQRARRHMGHLAVLFIDLDGFKRVNDAFGHAVGDRLLQSVAARLAASVRKSDTVSRLGGDEFVILLPEIAHFVDAADIAEKIIDNLETPHRIGRHRIKVGASIGISTYPASGDDAETLIASADSAMYHAKEQGRGRYRFFDRDMTRRAAERQSVEGQLHDALARRELVLQYQPKVSLATGLITSAEALLRWRHPTRGMLLPAHFLPAAEDNDLIVAIGRWVMQEACRQTREWLDAGVPGVPVAVNVSTLEFRGDQFVEGVQHSLADLRLDPGFLELEMTESVLMRDADATMRALRALKALGVRLAVDDFGAGHSSLSYLTRLPLDTLKLHQSFMRDIGGSDDDAVVLSAVINMGKTLKHRVIAGGVETSEQLEFLQARGCDEGQGHFFSPPVMPAEFATLLQTGISHPG